MDQSFELLSSMSPKNVLKQKPPKKGATLLALKRNIRRSAMYEKASATVKNEDLYLVESNFTESTTNSVESLPRGVNQTPIVISDTDESDKSIHNDEPIIIENNITKTKLSNYKLDYIKRWIESVNVDESKNTDVTKFSEVSTIYGDPDTKKFVPKLKGCAINSTFVDAASKKFDELFGSKLDIPSPQDSTDGEGLKGLIIDDSFGSRIKEEIKDVAKVSNKYTPDANKVFETPDNTDLECMLDSLYGQQWRHKQDLILPKTEPRKNNVLKSFTTNTECKPKTSQLYKNPYLDIEKSNSTRLLKKLQTFRSKTYQESPLVTRLKLLCDSESNSENSADNQVKPQTLNFNDSSDEISPQDKQRTPKYFKNKPTKCLEHGLSNKENIKQPKVKNKIANPTTNEKKHNKDPKTMTDLKTISTNSGSSKTSTNKKTDEKKKSSSGSSSISISSNEEWDKKISKIHRSSLANGTYSFLESLSGSVPILRCDMAARIYRSNFNTHRDNLLAKLFKLYNARIFDDAIPHDTTMEWNDRMRGTAGFCYCTKITRRTGTIERSVRIVLASKVVDSADRLRDTLVHEMCHAATWIVNCISDGHGTYWKAWALKAMRTFPELPPIRRCHDYVINTKYTYKCTGCSYSIGRHTKSLDIERKRCGHCYGKFEVLINKRTKKGETKSVAATPKKAATGFALFVKTNYGIYKNPVNKHGDVMKILGQKFQELKLKQ